MSLDARKATIALLSAVCLFGTAMGLDSSTVMAQVPASAQSGKQIHEPVHRISNRGAIQRQEGRPLTGPGQVTPAVARDIQSAPFQDSQVMPASFEASIENGTTKHPLDPALRIARKGLDKIRAEIKDYTCYMVKRERVNGRLSEKETMFVKIRNRHQTEKGPIPFSIYMRFVDPSAVKGREVIWVEGRNNDQMVAHDTGLRGLIRVNLDPEGRMAMNGNRYPIYEAGLENLVVKLIEKAERDRKAGDCEVEFFQGAEINGRECTVIQVTHPEKREPYDFHMARVYIDNEYQVPIRYAAFSWPKTKGGSPVLEEEYTYLNLKVNVGLTEKDFDPDNPEYDYP